MTQPRTADELVRIQWSQKRRVYTFIERNPNASARAIRTGVGINNTRVAEILAAGVASGELVMAHGRWGSQTYVLKACGLCV